MANNIVIIKIIFTLLNNHNKNYIVYFKFIIFANCYKSFSIKTLKNVKEPKHSTLKNIKIWQRIKLLM